MKISIARIKWWYRVIDDIYSNEDIDFQKYGNSIVYREYLVDKWLSNYDMNYVKDGPHYYLEGPEESFLLLELIFS